MRSQHFQGMVRENKQHRREEGRQTESVRNTFWVYSIDKESWLVCSPFLSLLFRLTHFFQQRCCAYDNDNTDPKYWAQMADVEPWPRYAHQLVYDSIERKHYLFGGRPSDVPFPEPRLGDFWLVPGRITNHGTVVVAGILPKSPLVSVAEGLCR